MRALIDSTHLLKGGLANIRQQFRLPEAFPPAVMAAAEKAVQRQPTDHADWTHLPFVTLDPASSTDLDQAFHIEADGTGWLLHYAIADVGWFVHENDALDAEAWKRGTTQYLPDGKVSLYPPLLSEGAASLLPDGPRPAVVFSVRIGTDGDSVLDGVTRAIIHSRAKLAYATVREADLPAGFAALTAAVLAAERARGAARIDPPEQEVSFTPDGSASLSFAPRYLAEDQNAALSLTTNLAVAKLFVANNTGLFRVMEGPEPRSVARLRFTAKGLGLDWAADAPLKAFERSLDPANPHEAAFMLAVRRAGNGARYAAFDAATPPWHSAIAAPYAHATAPLRRLADRYVIRAALALANGDGVPTVVLDAFARLPKVMAGADALGGQLYRAAVDLAEAVLLHGREGERFAAVVTDTDERGARIQLCDWPITARATDIAPEPGTRLEVTLLEADPVRRVLRFAGAA